MRTSSLPWLTACAAYVIGAITPVSAQLYFDFDNSNGLTATGSAASVDWSGNYWQTSATPGGAIPGAYSNDSEVYFATAGLNLIDLSGNVSVFNLYQEAAGTSTVIGGTGQLNLTGQEIINESNESLRFGKDIVVSFEPLFGDAYVEATGGSIIFDGRLSADPGTNIQLLGDKGIELNGNNSEFQGAMEIGGLVILGSNQALSENFNFDGGTLQYANGVLTDHSEQFANLANGSVVRIDTNANNITWRHVWQTSPTPSAGIMVDIVKSGKGRLFLAGNMPNYGGKITVEEGILVLGPGPYSAGSNTDTPIQGIEVKNGSTLDISFAHITGTQLVNEHITLSGHGVGNLGAIMKNINSSTVALNRVHLSGHTTLNLNARWDVDSRFQANNFSITKIGSEQLPFEGGNSVTDLGNIFIKQGTVNFTGSTKMGPIDRTISVNSGTGLLFWSGSGTEAKMIELRGGHITRNGDVGASQGAKRIAQGGLRITAGNSEVRHGNSQLIFELGNIQRTVGSLLNVADTSGIVYGATTGNTALATTTLSNTAGIIGGWMTYGGRTWAVNSGTTQIGSTTNVVIGLGDAGYAVNDFSISSNNVDVNGSTATPSGWTVNSLRFNTASSSTLTLSGINTIASGGILVTTTVGANNITLNGGTIRGSASGELIVHQNNTAGELVVSSVIADNTGATALIKSGLGTMSLRTINSYSGNTYIYGAPGSGSRGILDVNDLKTSGNDNLGSTSNQIYFNNGTLRYSNTTENAELARQIHLLSGGGAINVANANRTLLLSGRITGETLEADEGHFYGQGNLIKEGLGILEISNASNDYTGETIVNGGILRVVGAGRLGANISRLTVNNGGILELNGSSQQMGLLMGSAGGMIRNGAAGDSTLSIGNDDSTHVASGVNWGFGNGYAGSIQDGSGGGKVSLEKNGVGYQILSGVNTYSGTTTINDGYLQVGSGTGATSTARTGTGLHTVKEGATLAGNGIIGGSVVVEKDGVLSVGNFGQTAAQTLTIDGGLDSVGNISLDLWSHVGTTTTADQLRFNGNGVVNIVGNIVVNNMITEATSWAENETIKFFSWGSNASRTLTGNFDVGNLALADELNTYWDTRRLMLDGVIMVRSIANALIWDSDTGTPAANDGSGTWNTANNNWINDANANGSFVNGSDVWIGQNNGTGNATITVNNTGGVTVRDITFDRAGTVGSNNYYYTIAGGEAANNILNLVSGAMITTDHALEENLGTTISTRISGTSWFKAGEGRLILTGNNNFTGDLNVLQGVLDVRHNNALGTTAGRTIVHGGATLTVRGSSPGTGLSVAEGLELNGYGANNQGVLRNQVDNNTFSGAITLASDSYVTSRDGTLTLSGVISGAGDLMVRTESGTAFVTLSGSTNNTYTGNTIVRGGTLILNKGNRINAIAANTNILIGGYGESAVLRLDQHNQIADNVVVNLFGTGSTAGVMRLNGRTETIGALRSTNGQGIVENVNAADGSITVNNTDTDHYSGILRNGTGNGVLHFVKSGAGVQELSGYNTYTGSTTINNGILRILGVNGQLDGTSEVFIAQGGVFELYNTASAKRSDRLRDEAIVKLNNSRFRFANDGAATSYTESIGVVQAAGNSVVENQQAAVGGSSTLTLEDIQRFNHGILSFEGVGLGEDTRNRIMINQINDDRLDHGLLGAWVIVGNDFATYGANGVEAYDDYLSADQSVWSFRDNVEMSSNTTLTGDRYVNSLKWQQSADQSLNLGGSELRIESGGLILSGNYNAEISNGTLTAGTSANAAGDLIIHQNTAAANQLNITASITDNGEGKVTLVKSGQGRLLLSGDNSYSGGLVINDGVVVLNHSNALPSTEEALIVQRGTLDLNGYSVAIGGLISERGNVSGVILNNGATRSTLTMGQGNQSGSYYGAIQKGTGGVNVIKTGKGMIGLYGTNTIDGTIVVEDGTLLVGHASALGENGAGKETIVHNGATIEFAAEGTYNEILRLSGHGFNNEGVLVTKDAILRGGADQLRFMNVILDDDITINNYNKRIDFDGSFNAQGNALTKLGSNEMTFEGNAGITNLGDVYVKAGHAIWGNASSWGNSDSSLVIHSNASAQFYNVSLTQSKVIVLKGGTMRRTGPNGSSVNGQLTANGGLQLHTGASLVGHSNSATVFHLGSIQRQTGATLNIDNAAGLATVSNTNTNGILGGWVIMGNSTWAVNSTNGVNGAVTAYNSFTTSANPTDWTAASNVSLAANPSAAIAAPTTINTLRFTGNSTVSVNSDLIISSGGILNTGSSNVTISGSGTLRGSASGELYIHQNSSALMTIGVSIVDNGGATALVKTGSNTLRLTGNNTYTGGTYINGNHGGTSWGTLEVSQISDTGNSNIGQSSGGSHNAIYFNRGRLVFNDIGETARNLHLLSGGAELSIGGSLTLNGAIHGEELAENEGFSAEQGILRILGGGTVTLGGSEDNTYTGNTYIDNGTLNLNKDEDVTAVGGNLIVGSNGEVYWEASHQIVDTSVITLNGGLIDMSGFSEKIAGLVSTNEDSYFGSFGIDTSELEIEVKEGLSHSYYGTLEGDLKLVKTGEGTQILSGNLHYEGGTHIAEGVLQVGNGQSDEVTSNIGYDGGVTIDAGARLVINSASEYFAIEQDITGDGDFEQAGPGVTVFSEDYAHTYTGNTYVTGGTLVVNSKVAVDPADRGQVYVTGGKLAGMGIVNGNTVVKELGTIDIGDSNSSDIGNLTVNGDLALQRSIQSEPARLVFEINWGNVYNDTNLHESGSAYSFANLSDYYSTVISDYHYDIDDEFRSNDKLIVEGSLTLDAGAVLLVNNIGHTFAAGDVFDLADWANLMISNAVDGGWNVNTDLILPELTMGLNWDRSLFLSHGIVTIIVPEPSRMVLLMLGAMFWMTRRKRRPGMS